VLAKAAARARFGWLRQQMLACCNGVAWRRLEGRDPHLRLVFSGAYLLLAGMPLLLRWQNVGRKPFTNCAIVNGYDTTISCAADVDGRGHLLHLHYLPRSAGWLLVLET